MRKKTAIEMSKCLDDISSGIEMIGNFKDNKYVVSKVEKMFKENLAKLDSEMDDIGKEKAEALKEAIKSMDSTETKRLISEIRTFISKNIVYKVVFMPYKASMWDSLESIWMAADKDERCEALVVPITYYELDNNQNPIKKVNERNLFPKYVNAVKDEEYDLENDLPDIIYIHNPYDNTNLVTRVDSRYYSWNLKKYCEKLVYVPYGKWVDGVSLPRFMIGMYNSDYAIQSSDNAVEKYSGMVNDYAKCFGIETVEARKILKHKFVNLGSPKVDKVLSLNKENTLLPNDWKGKVLKSRVNVLYNTTLEEFLNTRNLDKIRETLNFFKYNSSKAFTIWRPHPLMRQTLISMLPNLLKEYDELMEEFCNGDYGIIDTNASMYYSIFWSDMCYGFNNSSLNEIYKYTGKIVLQDFPKMAKITSSISKENLLKKLKDTNVITEPECSLPDVVNVISDNIELKIGKKLNLENSGEKINNYMIDIIKKI